MSTSPRSSAGQETARLEDPIMSVLESERLTIERDIEKHEAAAPDHLTAIDAQLEYQREAARLRGMGEEVLRITTRINEITPKN